MKKVFLVLLVCFMALGAKLAMADTRTDALGLTAGQQVDDLDSIWMFPQDAGNFGNVVDVRLGNPNGSNFGDWGGIIHKDFDEIGYIGVYVNRPFNQNDNIAHSTNPANQNGITNGFTNWAQMINPSSSSYYGSNYLSDSQGNITGHYAYWPYGESAALNYYVNSWFGAGMNLIKVADPTNKADIFWSKDFSDITLGAHFNYANQRGNDSEYGNGNGSGTGNYTQGTPTLDGQQTSTFNQDSSLLGLDLGLTLKNLGSNMSLALGLGYSMGTVNYQEIFAQNYITVGTMTTWDSSTIKDNNISELRADALLKNKMNDTTNGRFYGNVRLSNLGFTNNVLWDNDGDGTAGNVAGEVFKGTSTYTDTNINLGIACDHSVSDGKAKVIVGLGVIYDGRKWSQTMYNNLAGSTTANQVLAGSGSTYNEDWWVVPFNVAIEAPVYDWLTARMGLSKNLYNSITGKINQLYTANAGGTAFVNSTTISNAWDSDTAVNLTYGMSAKFNNLTIDMQLNPTALLNDAKGFSPGQGIVYGNSANGAQAGSAPSQLFATIMQADMRYAF